MADSPPARPTFSPLSRWGIAFSVGVGIVAALALALMANYLSARHHLRFQLALHHQVKLSPQTVRVLRSLTNDVRITLFFDTRDEEELYGLVSGLLSEYNDVNPRVNLRTVDPIRHPSDAELVLSTYRLTSLKNRNFVVLDCGGRTRVIYQSELADYDYSLKSAGPPPEYDRKLVAFKGEKLFTEAIFNLANPRQFKVCFTQGHGEHDPETVVNPHGYSKFAQALKEEANAVWERITLTGTNEIAPDCQLLIIAGPRQNFRDSELAKIEAFLRQGGRLLVLMSSPALAGTCGLDGLLAKWNVGLGTKIILDPTQSPVANALLTFRLNTKHPVMKALVSDSEDNRLELMLPRAVGPVTTGSTSPDAPRLDVLAVTSDSAIEVSDVRDGVPYPNPFQDRKGAWSLIVAVEQGGIAGITPERGATRLIVVGDALCLDNEIIDQPNGNHYFGILAVNWLLDRPQVLLEGLVPQPVTTYRLVMSQQQVQTAEILLLGALPGLVLLFGAAVWWRRRH